MEKVAFITGGVFIYWSSIILALSALVAIALFAALYLHKSKNVFAVFVTIPLAAFASIVLGRLIHWYCRADAYESFEAAMSNYASGGYALMGVFAGCILTACVLRLLRVTKNLPQMLDCMALSGGVGIAVGRMASLFNSSDRGVIVADHLGLPFAYPVTNVVSGAVENRLATFMLQSIFVGLLVLVLAGYVLWCRLRNKQLRDGDITLLFLGAYGGGQVFFDSTRYDSLFMRSNGFISIVQILGVVSLALVMIIFSVRMVRKHRFQKNHAALWGGFAAALGIAAYMEYYVQRHGDKAVMAYSIMSVAIVVMIALTVVVRQLWLMEPKPVEPREKRPAAIRKPRPVVIRKPRPAAIQEPRPAAAQEPRSAALRKLLGTAEEAVIPETAEPVCEEVQEEPADSVPAMTAAELFGEPEEETLQQPEQEDIPDEEILEETADEMSQQPELPEQEAEEPEEVQEEIPEEPVPEAVELCEEDPAEKIHQLMEQPEQAAEETEEVQEEIPEEPAPEEEEPTVEEPAKEASWEEQMLDLDNREIDETLWDDIEREYGEDAPRYEASFDDAWEKEWDSFVRQQQDEWNINFR